MNEWARVRGVGIVLFAASCGCHLAYNESPDAGVLADVVPADAHPVDGVVAPPLGVDADFSGLSCADLARRAQARLAADSSCNGASDCEVIAYVQSCNGGPSLSGDCSTIVNAQAYAADTMLHDLGAQFDRSCMSATCGGGVPCLVDCAPIPATPQCLDHMCTGETPSCLVPPPDAGPSADSNP